VTIHRKLRGVKLVILQKLACDDDKTSSEAPTQLVARSPNQASIFQRLLHHPPEKFRLRFSASFFPFFVPRAHHPSITGRERRKTRRNNMAARAQACQSSPASPNDRRPRSPAVSSRLHLLHLGRRPPRPRNRQHRTARQMSPAEAARAKPPAPGRPLTCGGLSADGARAHDVSHVRSTRRPRPGESVGRRRSQRARRSAGGGGDGIWHRPEASPVGRSVGGASRLDDAALRRRRRTEDDGRKATKAKSPSRTRHARACFFFFFYAPGFAWHAC